MKGEGRSKIEHAQQYGMTSVPFDPDPEKDGKPGMGPETFIQFMGGNRSFPVAGAIDDRRHRLKGLKPGDVALFRGAKDGIQFILSEAGATLSHFADKKFRTQIVQKGEDGAKDEMGQKSILENISTQFFEMTNDGTTTANKVINAVAESGLTNAVKSGALSLVGQSFKVGAPGSRLRADGVPTPDAPTAFDIIGTASASSPIPAGTSTSQLATTAVRHGSASPRRAAVAAR